MSEETDLEKRKHLEIAYKHAFRIQHRKDVEARILSAMEELAEIPQETEPTPAECQFFFSSISIFQPSDFEDLIVERVSQVRCGYGLCAQQPRLKTSRSWNSTAAAANFCSNQCNAKATFIKAQLQTLPAWERTSNAMTKISLLQQEHNRWRNAADELASERGEKASSTKPAQVMTGDIVERPVIQAPEAPIPGEADTIEGYLPNTTVKDLSIVEELQSRISSPHTYNTAHQPSTISQSAEEQAWSEMFEHMKEQQ